MYAVVYEDEIRLWWDVRKDFKPGYKFKITVNDECCAFTPNVYYDFKNLEAGKNFTYTVQLLDQNGNPVGYPEVQTFSTLPARARIDVTKAPYCAKGDGKTDCTAVVQKAFNDCSENEYVYFPLGVYVCGELKFNSVKIKFDSGAVICGLEKVNELC